MKMEFTGSAEHSRAIDWAMAQVGFDHAESISTSDWACTYRLDGPSGSHYLKIVPPVRASQIGRLLRIAEQFSDAVPPVVAADPREGWLIVADHGGRTVSIDNSDEALIEVARAFGALQARAARLPGFLESCEIVDTRAMSDALSAFLDTPESADGASGSNIGVSYFVGAAEARRYARLFESRLPLLRDLIDGAPSLPVTLAHGDLHAGNAAIRPDGRVMFIDWDEAAAGPAGLCLHGLFAGCASAIALLARMSSHGSAGDSAKAKRLQAYIDALVDGGYASRDALLAGLAASLCAGQIRFILSFAAFPGELQRKAAANTIRARLSDLLDLCDWLACRSPELASRFSDDYEQRQEWRRAHRIVEDQLARQPQTAELLLRYSRLSYQLGQVATAEEAARESLSKASDPAPASVALAQALLGRLDLDGCAALLDQILTWRPDNAQAKSLQARVRSVHECLDAAAQDKGWPVVAVTDEERERGQLAPDTLSLLVELFRRYGAVQVDNVYSEKWIAHLQRAFGQRYGEHFHDGEHAGVLQVGDKRYMLTMELDEVFGAPELVASDLLMPVMRRVLGKECILSAYTAVISLPGSEDQRLHKDHSELFEEEGWHLEHPSFAAQIIVPLLALNKVTGATRVYKGTQRVPLNRCADKPYQDPVVPLGSCVLLDYSVAHLGRGNRSAKVRPILNLIYSRPWFRDCRNYHLQPPLRFSNAYYQDAPSSVRDLVKWWDVERDAARRPEA